MSDPAPVDRPVDSIARDPGKARRMTMTGHLSAHGLTKSYWKGRNEVPVLRGVDLEIEPGEMLAVVGASGSGKSTLLHILGLLDAPDSGRVRLEGDRIDDRPAAQRDLLRNRTFGFIFQFYHLLPELSALENVLMPLMIRHSTWSWLWRSRKLKSRAVELLERVGLGHRLSHRPRELSGGEMQRAAIARALVAQPRILLAEEPTGNLDAANGAHIIRLLRDLNRDDGLTIIMVTHNLDLVTETDRVVRLVDGLIDDPLAHAVAECSNREV